MKRILFLAVLSFLSFVSLAGPRHRQSFDYDWKFSLSDDSHYSEVQFDDSQWQDVQLPHDWNILQERVKVADPKAGIFPDGSAAGLPDGIGWYRKHFSVPASDKGLVYEILFDGIFMQSDVYLNGQHLGFHPYGYSSVHYDLSPYLNYGGDNIIAVRTDTKGGRPRWCAGGGLYRHVHLIKTSPLHIPVYGTYVTTPVVSAESAEVNVVTTIKNQAAKDQSVLVIQRILDASGVQVAKETLKPQEVQINGNAEVGCKLLVKNPHLWDVNDPYLYTVETTFKVGGKVMDVYTTTLGIRTMEFTSDRGFLLNGKRLKLQGLCFHSDGGIFGNAVPTRFFERRLEIAKEYGCNAIRCAHNQPSAEFLDLCDQLGFVVIDEAFDKWKSGYYAKYFDQWWESDLKDMILRDRNHPSIALWSIGNELQEAWDDSTNVGVERSLMLSDFVHKLEPTRPTILAAQNNHQFKFAKTTDVTGYNYLEARMLSEHKADPSRKVVVTEELPYYCGEEGNIRAYSTINPWNYIKDNDFVAGGFIWSGPDYLGEASSNSYGWPNGLFDINMLEKPRAAYHRAMWNPTPMVHIAVPCTEADIDMGRDLWQWPRIVSHWNLPDSYLGMVIPVQTVTNCEKVELICNGRSMGIRETKDFVNNTIIWNVSYTLGSIEARGYNGDELVATYQLKTAGDPVAAQVLPDRTMLKADGQDLSHILVQLVDADGVPVCHQEKNISVSVEGDIRLIGIDNGDMRNQNKDTYRVNPSISYFGHAMIYVQSLPKSGAGRVKVSVEGIEAPYVIEISSK